MPEGSPGGIIFRYFWLIALAVTFVNAVIWRRRAQPFLQKHPDREEGVRVILRGWVTFLSIPWVVMGIGIVLGGVPGVFSYFSPRTGGPFVLAWWGSNFVLWLLAGFWLFAMDGAEKLIKYNAPLNLRTENPSMVKLYFVISVIAGAIAFTLLWRGFFEVPA
jgi:hypothetical protein